MDALALQTMLHKGKSFSSYQFSRHSSAGLVLFSSGGYKHTTAGVFHGQFGETYRLEVGGIRRLYNFLAEGTFFAFVP